MPNIDPSEYDIDLTGGEVEIIYLGEPHRTEMVQAVLDQPDGDLVVDLTHATTELHPELPPWAENESKDFYQLFSEGSIDKAALLLKGHKVEQFKDGWFQVIGSELYTVQVIANPYGGVPWTTCTCPNGQNRSSRPTCYHSAAVLMHELRIPIPGYFHPCSNCAADNMDTEACPNIKHECLDCCGCPDH